MSEEARGNFKFIVQDTFHTSDGERIYPTEVNLKRPDGTEEIWGTQRLLDEIERIRQETTAKFYGDRLPTDKDSIVGKIINRTKELLDSAVEVQDIYSDDREKGVELVRIPEKGDKSFESVTVCSTRTEKEGRVVVRTSIKMSNNEPLWVELDNKRSPININNNPKTQSQIVTIFKERIVSEIGTESELRIFDQAGNAPDFLGDESLHLFPSLIDDEYFMDSSNSKPVIEYAHDVAAVDLPLMEAYWSMLEPSKKVHVDDMNARHKDQTPVEPEVTGLYHDMLMKQIREEKKITDPTPPNDKI